MKVTERFRKHKAMQITREAVARKLAAYLHHEISFDDLVAWANAAMMEDDFEEAYYDAIRDAVAPWVRCNPIYIWQGQNWTLLF